MSWFEQRFCGFLLMVKCNMGSETLRDMLVSEVEPDEFCVNYAYCLCSSCGGFAREIDS